MKNLVISALKASAEKGESLVEKEILSNQPESKWLNFSESGMTWLDLIEMSKFYWLQAECIKAAQMGKDVIARSKTGSGKTLAYVIPALHKLFSLPPNSQQAPFQTLILVPTKELCLQVIRINLISYNNSTRWFIHTDALQNRVLTP